jgi:serine/threonine-protein kinase
MAIEAGRVLNERYRLIRPVGQGSQASVWVAEHLALTTHVAVKLIDPELAKKETARERFRREATAAAQLRSAHVVQILDHGIDGTQPFIVMELLDGEDLFERLAHRTRLTLRETSKIVTQVARALSRAHAAGIVHRDLKPENVFLVPNDDDEVVKVLDFGVAKVKDAAKVTMQKTGVGTLIGTPHYMSPEQVKGIGEIDHRTDLWALGVIAFQCVTGDLPYDSEGVGDLLIKITIADPPVPSKVYPGVHANFDSWFAKACERDPAKRFQSAREMAVALAGVVGAIDGVVPRPPTVRPPAASMPTITTHAIPAPARVPGDKARQELASTDLEEIEGFFDEDEDNQPTAMKPLPTPAPPRPAASAPPARPATPPPAAKPARELPPAKPPVAARPPAAAAKPAAPPRPLSAPPPRPLSAPPPRPVSSPPPAETQDSQDIVDFDETIPANDARLSHVGFPLMVRANPPPAAGAPSQQAPLPGALSALVPLSEPPPRPPSAPPPAPASSARSGDAIAPGAVLAPVMAMPPRSSTPEPPAPASIPRPAPPSAPARTTPAPVVRPVEIETPARAAMLLAEAPPEFDGSKRRRLVRFFLAGLVLCAVGITWTVVRSQLDFSPGVPASTTTASAAPAPTPTPSPPSPASASASAMATAIDPGKVKHPTVRPNPSAVKGPVKRWKKPLAEGEVEIHDPPADDSVPPAP